MIIAVNTNNPHTRHQYLLEVFLRLAIQNPQHSFIFIFCKPFNPATIFPGNIMAAVISSFPKKPLLWKLWFDYKIPPILKKYKADVFVSIGICSLRTKVPQCLIINDLLFLEYPHFSLKSHFNFYKSSTPKFIKKAKVIVTASEFSKQNIIQKYKTEDDKINIIPIVADESFVPVNFEIRENTKEKYAGGNEYFLFSGDITSKNNLLNLLKAFSFFKKRQKSNMRLLICGELGWKHEEFIESLGLFKFKNEVTLYHNLPKDELAKVIASAYAIVDVSYFQSFNEVPLKAMKCEVPLIVSNSGVMTEMYSDAALYINPKDHKAIAEKMMLIFKDEELRKQLIEKGKQQVQKYDHDEMLLSLWKSILKTSS